MSGCRLLIQPDTVIKSGYNRGKRVSWSAIVAMERCRYDTDVFFDVPDALSSTALIAENIDIVLLALRVVSRKELEKGGFSRAVWSRD